MEDEVGSTIKGYVLIYNYLRIDIKMFHLSEQSIGKIKKKAEQMSQIMPEKGHASNVV